MKFENAFDIAFEQEKTRLQRQGINFTVQPTTAKTLAFFWNMLKASENVLDDFVFIDNNNRIISISEPEKQKSSKTAKIKDNQAVNGEKPEQKTEKTAE